MGTSTLNCQNKFDTFQDSLKKTMSVHQESETHIRKHDRGLSDSVYIIVEV